MLWLSACQILASAYLVPPHTAAVLLLRLLFLPFSKPFPKQLAPGSIVTLESPRSQTAGDTYSQFMGLGHTQKMKLSSRRPDRSSIDWEADGSTDSFGMLGLLVCTRRITLVKELQMDLLN